MKVLIVSADEAQAAALSARFGKRFKGELELHHAKSALEALMRLRQSVPELIVCAREASGISGLEFLLLIRESAVLRQVPFILLDSEAGARFTPTGREVILGSDAHPADVLEAAFELLAPAAPAPPPPHSRATRATREVKVSGTLEVMTLFDLVLSLTQKRNSGRLYVILGAVEALLVFHQGRFVHAQHQELTGEAAVLRIFLGAEQHPDAEFFFEPTLAPPSSVSLHSSVQELLLKVAVALDHHRSALAANATG